MKQYLKDVLNTHNTPQSQPIPGTNQVPNHAGGFAWSVSEWEQMRRFLILGSEGGTYYVGERALTAENAQNLIACIQQDGVRVVNEIVAISEGGRAPKNDPAIFALALAASIGDESTKKAAFDALPKVCRIGTHLFSFVEMIQTMRGWGRSVRRAVGDWYNSHTPRDLAYQVVKYRQRGGWTHVDTLRKAHPTPSGTIHDALFKWITKRDQAAWATDAAIPEDSALAFVHAFERVQKATDEAEILQLIREYRLPREALPTEALRSAAVWEALLQDMPMTAMIRNLGVMSKVKLLTPGSAASQKVVAELTNVERLRKARVHPIAILSALRVYAKGFGMKGGNISHVGEQEWIPVPAVIDALDTAFDLAFQAITPTNKATMLALDVSGSMGGGVIAGIAGLTPREASAAMALVTARTESNYWFAAFQSELTPLNITGKMRLDTVIQAIGNLSFGSTDCAAPMYYALDRKIKVEAFYVYTDSETWVGTRGHPSQALKEYRQKMSIDAKLVVVGMTATNITIADPNDKGMLDVVGFDTSAPSVMSEFVLGKL